ncbi:helix-turn-helix DNA binding domain protein [Mycobacterium phage Tucker]|nr:helix-turn-helix DNA binding domain protein [Mycobacterium phage Tucker]
MRKKELKAELSKARGHINELIEELDDAGSKIHVASKANIELRAETATLRESNKKLADRLNEALAENRLYAMKQRSQYELFGRALVQVQPERGPKRPNRKKLTSQEVRDIRDAYYGGASQKQLAKNYGVNPATISRTVRGVYH